MAWLFETPWPGFFVCLVAALALGVMLLRTGRGQLLWAMAAVAILAIVLVTVERLVVTDREQVEDTLDRLAAALKKNDAPQVISFISPSNQGLRSYAAQQLKRARIRDAKITGDLSVQIKGRQNPPTATANFIGRIEAVDLRGRAPYGTFISRFEVQLRNEGGRWLITGYEFQELAARPAKKGAPGPPLPSPVPGI